MVPKAEHLDALLIEKSGSDFVSGYVFRIGMLTTIDLKSQTGFPTIKVQDIVSERDLAFELVSLYLM